MRSLAAVVALLLLGAAPPPLTQGKITSIEVRFFDQEKGEFGPNVIKNGAYFGWNDFLKEANAGYGTGDAIVLVKVAVKNRDEGCCIIRSPLTIVARRHGKLLARRQFSEISTWDGEVARPLYLQNIGCSGRIDITATISGETRTARLEMACGE